MGNKALLRTRRTQARNVSIIPMLTQRSLRSDIVIGYGPFDSTHLVESRNAGE